MARPSKPWFNKSRQAWVTTIGGRHYTLARGRAARREAAEAFRRLRESLANPDAPPGDLGAVAMLDYFLDSIRGDVAEITWEFYRRHTASFSRFVGPDRLAGSISDDDVRRWLAAGWLKRLPGGRSERRPYGQTTRRGAIVAVKRAFAWAKKKKLIAEDPLAEIKPPPGLQSKAVLDESAVRRIIAGTDGPFRDLVELMWETGCRPSEAMRLEAKDIDFGSGVVRMHGKTTRKTGKERILYLTPRATEILRANAEGRPDGPVLRNKIGNPWRRHAIAQRFARLRASMGLGADGTAEAIRHAFGTDGAMKLPPMVLAHIMGHTSTAMINRYYVHLDRRQDEMRAAMNSVRGGGSSQVSEGLAVGPAAGPAPIGGGGGTDGGTDNASLDVGPQVRDPEADPPAAGPDAKHGYLPILGQLPDDSP